MLSIWASFAELPDPRTGNAQRHNLLDVLTIALNAVICGAESQPSCPAQGGGRMVCRSAIAGRTRTCEHRRRARPHRSAPPCGQPRRRLDAVGPPPSRRGEAAGPGHDRDGRGHRLARLIPAALWINTYGPLSCCDTANLSWDGLRVIPRLTAGIDDGVIVVEDGVGQRVLTQELSDILDVAKYAGPEILCSEHAVGPPIRKISASGVLQPPQA